MLAHLLKETKCHACENMIGRGQLICKACGRFRGIGGRLQIKQWELTVAAIGLFLIGCFLCFALITLSAKISVGPEEANNVPNNQVPEQLEQADDNEQLPPVIISKPTSTRRPEPTSTPKSDFASYSCPDKSQVKLRVGDRAVVVFDAVNLRSSPKVPDIWDANIVHTLLEGDRLSVVGGPICAHEGTWWEVKTDSGYTGWAREMQTNKVLLGPIK